MIDKWTFKRLDETIFSSNEHSVNIMRWSGSSTWEQQRWLRDETRPDALDYYVATVMFRPLPTGETKEMKPNADLQLGPMPDAISIDDDRPSIYETELQSANVPAGLSADEVLAYFN